MRFHVLGIPHTITTPAYSSCAFTQKVVKLIRMLTMEGHEVLHYGHSHSQVPCRTIACTVPADLEKSYPGWDWKTQGTPAYNSHKDHCYKKFYERAIRQIEKRKLPGDFLLCPFGTDHKPVADAHPDLVAVESGIGYGNATFAPFRVFESYAVMHAHQGTQAVLNANNSFWYDAVIPNSFDMSEFEYSDKKRNYLLFLGRINSGKGIHIAKQLADTVEMPLIIVGAGDPGELSKWHVNAGVVGPDVRRDLLRDAKAVICASTFLEPFCGVQIEAMASGTPVISADRGAFAEFNLHGATGYRCKTLEQFIWAVKNIDRIEPEVCRVMAQRFSLEAIAPHYTDYFRSLADVRDGTGWYERHDERTTLHFSSFPPFEGA